MTGARTMWGDLLAGGDATFVALVALGTLVVVAMLFALVLLARRRLDTDVREVVGAIEEMRSGVVRKKPEVDPGSPMVLVADAVHRLSHDLHSRWAEAERAAERWKALTDASHDTAVITTDTDGDVRSFSGGATELFGWEEDEVVSRPAAVLFEESSYKDLLPKLTRKVLRHRGITTHCRLVRRDGTSFEAEASVRMLQSASGDPVGFLILVRDVTDQVRAQNELRESEARYRGLIERLGDGVLIVRGGRIAYANRAAELLLEAPGRQLAGTALRDRVATRDVLVLEERLGAVERGATADDEIVCTLVAAGGGLLDVRMRVSAVPLGEGSGVLILLRDETGQRRAEREILRNAARLDAVLEAASDGIVLVGDRGGRLVVQVANRAFAAMFDVPLGGLLGMSLEELASRLARTGATGVRAAELLRGSAESGSPITVADDPAANVFLLRVTALRDEMGSSIGRLLVCRDLTEQRRSERQLEEQAERLEAGRVELQETYGGLHEAHSELQRRNDELDRLNAELRRLDKMKSDLLGNVSHELQTPLVSVRGYTEMILRERLGPINEEQRKGLERSLASVDRMIAMIEGLLDVARADPARGAAARHALEPQTGLGSPGRRTRFPLRRVVEEAWELLREPVAEKRLEISIDTDSREPEPELEADRDELLQVLSNLLSNAIKHSPAGRRIEVLAVGRGPGRIELHVRDEGPGIPIEARERVFERCFQLRGPGEAAPAGSGLGLAIVREIVTRHGGTVRAAANPAGRGAAIVVTLPAAVPASISGEAPSERTTPSDRDAGGPRPPEGEAPRPRLRIIRKQRGDARNS